MPYIPKYLAREETQSTRNVITATHWNELFNLLITQTDYMAGVLNDLLNNDVYQVAGYQGIPGEPGPEGPEGPVGPRGEGLIIKGMYDTYEDLVADHPVGALGDTWAVGDDISNTLWVWDTAFNMWTDMGGIVGPQGNPGADGAPGNGLIEGGEVGQILRKDSTDDYDLVWYTPDWLTQADLDAALIIEEGITAAALTTKLGTTETAVNATKWNGRQVFQSSTAPVSGMVSGDIWFKPAS